MKRIAIIALLLPLAIVAQMAPIPGPRPPSPISHGAGCDGAGNCYVRAGATGAASGADWTNAYTALPSSLTRGVTYFVAAGTYGGHLFKDAESGTTLITVQAPTAAIHGTSTGWNGSYVGQAVFNTADSSGMGDIITFQTGYYNFNGAYRTSTGSPQSDWSSEGGYGFKIDNGGKVACNADLDFGDNTATTPMPIHYVTVEYVDINGSHETSATGCRENGIASMYGSNNLTIENNYNHDTGLTNVFMRGEHATCTYSGTTLSCGSPASGYGSGSNNTIEFNYFARDYSSTATHAEGCSCSEGLQNLTIANNYWQDIDGTAIIAPATGSDWNTGNGGNGPWYIYGNVVFQTSCTWSSQAQVSPGISGFVYLFDVAFTGGIYAFNNTIANIPASCNNGASFLIGDGTYKVYIAGPYDVENNLWWNVGTDDGGINNCSVANTVCGSGLTWADNAYFSSASLASADSTGTKQTASTNPFVSSATYNYQLAADTTAGTNTNSVLAANGTDMLGVTRGADGVWDRGALQIF